MRVKIFFTRNIHEVEREINRWLEESECRYEEIHHTDQSECCAGDDPSGWGMTISIWYEPGPKTETTDLYGSVSQKEPCTVGAFSGD